MASPGFRLAACPTCRASIQLPVSMPAGTPVTCGVCRNNFSSPHPAHPPAHPARPAHKVPQAPAAWLCQWLAQG